MSQTTRRQFLQLSTLLAVGSDAFAKTKLSHTGVVLDERFAEHYINDAHPESPQRYQAISEHLSRSKLLGQLQLIKPKHVDEKWLKTVHSSEHIDKIKSQQKQTHEHALIATGAVLAAIDGVCKGMVRNAFCASRPPGHHAKNTGKEEGFCYYNHIAIAARYAQQYYGVKKVLIVDWDYHHGNGTEWAFYSDPSVLFFSTHDMFAYPGTGSPERRGEGQGKGFNINVHLDCGAGDEDIVRAFKSKLLPVVADFSPDLILISAGFDSREDDLLGCHAVSDEGFIALTKLVKAMADKHCDGRIVSLLEGGYNIQGNTSAVVAHISELMR